jgi:two-component system, NtrC family, sensor kinase
MSDMMIKEMFRILLVDDEQVILNVMNQTLEGSGYTCSMASSGVNALQILQKKSADLVITDIRMPGMSGVQLADAVVMKHPDSLLVFMTGYAEYNALSQAIKQRPFGFLEKPFLPDQLLALVDRAFQHWNELRTTQVQGKLLEQLVDDKTRELEFKTERLMAEKDLLHGIIANANFGLMAVDASGQTHLLNPLAKDLLSIEETVYTQYHGLHYQELIPADCKNYLVQLLDGTQLTKSLKTAEFMNPKNEKHLNVIAYPIMHRNNVAALVLIVHDVSEKDVLQKRLLQSAKLASIGELAAGVAHEINNPLGFVMSNCNTLARYVATLKDYIIQLDKTYLTETKQTSQDIQTIQSAKVDMDIDFILQDQSELLKETLDGLNRVSKIVRDLKTFARADGDAAEQCEINSLIENALNLARNEIKYNLKIKKNFSQIPNVTGFPGQLVQVFTNMFVNAAHAVKEKGELTITTGVTDKVIRISIADNGEGISEKNIARIFDPFFTTKAPGKGTGMGLSISYGIIERHSGSISVKSEVGVGTEFIIELPFDSSTKAEQTIEQETIA